MSSECKGCECYSGHYCNLGIKPKMGNIKCPCSICLVKSMCKDDVCKEFIEYARMTKSLERVEDGTDPIVYKLWKRGKVIVFRGSPE